MAKRGKSVRADARGSQRADGPCARLASLRSVLVMIVSLTLSIVLGSVYAAVLLACGARRHANRRLGAPQVRLVRMA